MDVGCGIGDFVAWFNDHGINADGVEGTPNVLPYALIPDKMIIHDMRTPLPWYPDTRYDLAMSIEVAEHIDYEDAHIYVRNLCSLSDNLLLTIARPGQDGHGHVNLQPTEYWVSQFWAHNYFRDIAMEHTLYEALTPYIGNRWVSAIRNNLLFFRRT